MADKMAKHYCGKRTIYLTETELKLHNCLRKRKGKRKGKKCEYLVIK
jgi:hypothetical protein